VLLRDTEKYWPIEGVHVKLLRFGRGNRYMCSPYANLGKPPLGGVRDSVARGQGGMEKAISERPTVRIQPVPVKIRMVASASTRA
jgi:hypothetical protein